MNQAHHSSFSCLLPARLGGPLLGAWLLLAAVGARAEEARPRVKREVIRVAAPTQAAPERRTQDPPAVAPAGGTKAAGGTKTAGSPRPAAPAATQAPGASTQATTTPAAPLRLTPPAQPGADRAPTPGRNGRIEVHPASGNGERRVALPLAPTKQELEEEQRARKAQEELEVRHGAGRPAGWGEAGPVMRRVPTRPGNTSGPGGQAGAGTSNDRKATTLDVTGPQQGVRR